MSYRVFGSAIIAESNAQFPDTGTGALHFGGHDELFLGIKTKSLLHSPAKIQWGMPLSNNVTFESYVLYKITSPKLLTMSEFIYFLVCHKSYT
ncbi:hypothetical protein Q3G72_031083 [Acer saccharum]|nr:hypothetical protein Q3G72_031083 [Acer saccharum]